MKHILLDLQARDEGIAILKINRPEVLNNDNYGADIFMERRLLSS